MAAAAKEGAPAEQSWTFAPELGAGEGDNTSAVARSSRAGLLGAGQTIDFGREEARYEIVRSLGGGGMAEVFLARRLGTAGFIPEVALKCIRADLEVDERVRRAFRYEAQLATHLKHPNIAEAYVLLEVGDRYYLVLEYIEGVSVKSILQAARREQKKLSAGFCCYVAASVAEGLQYAHKLTGAGGEPVGIVHRDITPANVMVGVTGAVKLLDFGVAYARMQGRDRTQTGTVKGTYAYFSPEQAASRVLDGRSDLFSLGTVLVELLTGTRVFDSGSELETIQRIGECSTADVRAVTRGLPKGLQGICERALAKSPDERFQDGAEYSRALRGYLTQQGVSYWSSDCVAEVRALRGFAEPASSGTRRAPVTAQPPQTISGRVVRDDALPCVAEEKRGPSRTRGGVRPWRLAAGAVLGGAILVGTLAVLWHGNAGAAVIATGNVPELKMVNLGGAPVEPERRPLAAQSEGVAATSANTAVADDVVVRPKKRNREKRKGSVPGAASKGQDDAKSSATHLAERASVASATLPRGTLIRAKLVAALDAMRAGAVEAVVEENVMSGGAVVVPAGGAIICSSQIGKDGRVPVSCDSIKTADRAWSFSGLAVGEGQHVGLRVLDTVVPAGSSFVVYVDAEFR